MINHHATSDRSGEAPGRYARLPPRRLDEQRARPPGRPRHRKHRRQNTGSRAARDPGGRRDGGTPPGPACSGRVRRKRPRACRRWDGGKHLCNVPLQQQRIVGEHRNRMVGAELSGKREHGYVWLDRRPPSFDPLSCAEGIPHALAEPPQVLVRRYDTPFCLVLEPRAPDGGVDHVRALPAPRSE